MKNVKKSRTGPVQSPSNGEDPKKLKDIQRLPCICQRPALPKEPKKEPEVELVSEAESFEAVTGLSWLKPLSKAQKKRLV